MGKGLPKKKGAAAPVVESKPMAASDDQIIYLDPFTLATGDNVRFKLKPFRIDRMAEKIVEEGGIKTPIEVRPLTDEEKALPENKDKTFMVITGNYRTAAAQKLNEESNAGVMVPAIERHLDSQLAILKRQLSENNERENMSPMDNAYAISKLVEAGLPKVEIRKIFARPNGKKGISIMDASNAWVNIMLSFLDFPKHIQERIHDGRIGVDAGYQLRKKPEDQWKSIIETIEKKRLELLTKEEEDDQKIETQERRAAEQAIKEAARVEKQSQQLTELETAKAIVAESEEAAKTARATAAEAHTTLYKIRSNAKISKEDKAAAEKGYKELDGAAKQADATHAANLKALEKLLTAQANQEKIATERAARLEQARKNAAERRAASNPISGQEVNQTATDLDAGAAPVKLNASQIRDAINTVYSLAGIVQPKTRLIAEALIACFDKGVTPSQLHLALSKLVGEHLDKAGRPLSTGRPAAPAAPPPAAQRQAPPPPPPSSRKA